MFQIVSNVYNRNVITSLSIEEFINMVKFPDFLRKSQVDLARKIYIESPLNKQDPAYISIKNSLPCITFLNTFDNYVANENIVSPTGYMYVDVDKVDYINLSKFDFVVAYWKSLSNDGYGILIKHKINNKLVLQDCLAELSELFELPLDKGAVSKDRLNAIPYDNNIFYNSEYKEYVFNKETRIVSNSNNNPLSIRLQVNDTIYEEEKIRFSNLKEMISKYDFKGEPFIDLGDNKLQYAEVFVPRKIFEGNRNKSMFVLCSQIRGLNPWIKENYLFKVCDTINKDKFKPMLDEKELSDIVSKVFSKEDVLVTLNKTKRILFNPDYDLNKKEKQSMAATQIRGVEGEKNTEKIITYLNNWDFEALGKISQSKLAKVSGFGIATIKRRSEKIKDIFEILNQEYLHNKNKNIIFA